MNALNPTPRQRPLPSLPTIGGHGFRLRRLRDALSVAMLLVAVLLFVLISRPRVASHPIKNLQKNGVHGVYTLHASNGELLLYNFRAIEDGKLYRSSGFPRNHRVGTGDAKKLHPAALLHREAFNFLRAKNIRTVVTLNAPEDYYGEQTYLEINGGQTDYKIRLVTLTTAPELAYARGSRDGRRFGLRTASEFIDFMKTQAPEDGAVLLHDDAGKDGVGVVSAAYELWRNVGHGDSDTLWQQVLDRYLVSDTLIKRDKEVSKFAGKPYRCKNGTSAFVCAELLESLRPDLERIAQVN